MDHRPLLQFVRELGPSNLSVAQVLDIGREHPSATIVKFPGLFHEENYKLPEHSGGCRHRSAQGPNRHPSSACRRLGNARKHCTHVTEQGVAVRCRPDGSWHPFCCSIGHAWSPSHALMQPDAFGAFKAPPGIVDTWSARCHGTRSWELVVRGTGRLVS